MAGLPAARGAVRRAPADRVLPGRRPGRVDGRPVPHRARHRPARVHPGLARRPAAAGALSGAARPRSGGRGRLGRVSDEVRPRLARRAAVVTVLVSFAVVAVLAAGWCRGRGCQAAGWCRGRRPRCSRPEQIARAERYSGVQRVLGWSSYFAVPAGAAGPRAHPARAPAAAPAAGRRRWWVAVPLGALAVLVVERLVTLPFAVAAHRTDLRYGHQPAGLGLGWTVDQVKSAAGRPGWRRRWCCSSWSSRGPPLAALVVRLGGCGRAAC